MMMMMMHLGFKYIIPLEDSKVHWMAVAFWTSGG